MKSIYQRHVKEQLDAQVPLALPGYEPTTIRVPKVERKNVTLFPGSRLYRCTHPEGWATFIHFIPRTTQEELLVEVGWSLEGRFPVELSSRAPTHEPVNERAEPAWLIADVHRRGPRAGVGRTGA